jgi:dCMP deaminase
MSRKRKWDKRMMDLAKFISSWSKDPSTKVGAVICDDKYRVISVGFNGLPRGMSDDPEILGDRELKLMGTIHAEENALLFANRPLDGCTIFTYPLPPCGTCAAKIVQSGITRVVSMHPGEEHRERWQKHFSMAKRAYGRRVSLHLMDKDGKR